MVSQSSPETLASRYCVSGSSRNKLRKDIAITSSHDPTMTCGHGREAERTSVKSALTAFGGLRSMSFETILPSALAAEAAPVRPPGSTVRWTSSGLAHAEPDHRRRVRETKTTVAVTSTPPSTDRSTGLPRGGVVDCSRILQVSPSGPSLISVLGSLTTSVSQPAARGCRLRDRPRRRQVARPACRPSSRSGPTCRR